MREDYLQSYEGDRFAESTRYVRRYPQELPVLGELLPEIQTPVQIISSLRDRSQKLAHLGHAQTAFCSCFRVGSFTCSIEQASASHSTGVTSRRTAGSS